MIVYVRLTKMPVSTARAALLKKRLDSFTKTLAGVEQGDVSSIHRARVASRRLRELLPTLHVKHPAAVHKLGKRLRKVTRRLGVVRELDVLAHLLDELHLSRRERSGAVGRVGMVVAKERDAARKRFAARVPVDEMRRIARKLDRVVADLGAGETTEPMHADRSWRWVIEARVARRATRLLSSVNDAGAVYMPERLHAVRIAMKKLRYAAELLAEGGGDAAAEPLKQLRRGQELLGQMHDLAVLLERVRSVQASLTPPNLALWRDLDALVVVLENDCRRLHARYMRSRDAIIDVTTAWSGGDKGRTRARAADPRRMRAS
jgi:CHAD domain-containing protein